MWTESTNLFNGHQMTRRSLLRQMTAGFGMIGLGGMLGQSAIAGRKSKVGFHFAPRAKRVIFLFMNGAPSHVDTFDPKPKLKEFEGRKPDGELYRKPGKDSTYMPSPFDFVPCGQSGIPVNETLPHLGSVIDDCCVIRSMHTDIPNHEPALLQMHTGNIQPIRPSLGSWLMYGLGSVNENLPGYVVLRPTPKIVVGPALWSNSFLPAEYQATSVITSDMRVDKLIENVRNPTITEAHQREQVDLVQRMNRLHAEKRGNDSSLEAQIKAMETAYRMQYAAMDSFDISKEPQHVRDSYGDTDFARSCLLARRLVEDGVRYVGVYYVNKGNQPWDTHSDHNDSHVKLCADADKASAALIADLKQRGMLDDTLVIWTGEFGRTPYSQVRSGKAKPGRDHHSTAFSTLLAGGGVKGGITYGESDELGMNAVENPTHVHDLHATILHLMGLDHEKLTYRWSGRDFRLTDIHGEIAQGIIA